MNNPGIAGDRFTLSISKEAWCSNISLKRLLVSNLYNQLENKNLVTHTIKEFYDSIGNDKDKIELARLSFSELLKNKKGM